jgi:hypothetical protein
MKTLIIKSVLMDYCPFAGLIRDSLDSLVKKIKLICIL